eukprot:1136904-Alexandrium_andersonii.AAC.1
MSASLVGSEMCIRDSPKAGQNAAHRQRPRRTEMQSTAAAAVAQRAPIQTGRQAGAPHLRQCAEPDPRP